MTIGKRIRDARKERRYTQAELGKKIGRVQSVVSDLERGELESWEENAERISQALAKPLSYFTGSGIEPDQPQVLDANSDLPDLVYVPEFDVRLSAGGGFIVDRETTRRMWPLPRFMVVDQLGLSPGRATIQEVIGDSMEPTISTGDYVLIDLTDQRVGLPGVFAIWDGDALVCKRLERVPGTEPPEMRLKSDNPLHGEYRVLEERVRVVGRVRSYIRRA